MGRSSLPQTDCIVLGRIVLFLRRIVLCLSQMDCSLFQFYCFHYLYELKGFIVVLFQTFFYQDEI